MFKNNETFEKIKRKTNIVNVISKYQALKKKGKNYFGVCPFHNDNNPSMSVSEEKQLFKCFTCGTGGDAATYVAKLKNISWIESMALLAKELGMDFELKKEKKFMHYNEKQLKIIEVLDTTKNFFMYLLNIHITTNKNLESYINKRGLDSKIIEKFEIGYAGNTDMEFVLSKFNNDKSLLVQAGLLSENFRNIFYERIIFPIKDIDNNTIAFSGRIFSKNDNLAKYINSPETNVFKKRLVLYNLNNSYKFIKKQKEVIITEGFMDVIALDKSNVFNTVAIMGTALNREQLTKLPNYNQIKINLMFDSDLAGKNAMLKSIDNIISINNNLYILINSHNLDPDEIFKKMGIDAINKIINNGKYWFDFLIDSLWENVDKNDPNEIKKFINSLKSYAKYIDEIVKDLYLEKIAKLVNVTKEVLYRHFSIQQHSKHRFSQSANLNNPQPITFKKSNNVTWSKNDRKELTILSSLQNSNNDDKKIISWFINDYKKFGRIFTNSWSLATYDYIENISKGNVYKKTIEIQKILEALENIPPIGSLDAFKNEIEKMSELNKN